ncbi:hypothetical protein sos41_32750 [Alphaproteobacteria bacterium SO-S41]|nr:hypothetical protein sos41_32750 [Alphaproteobacteria bacterium SO-S41]
MALFFDQTWFDAQLAERHLRRADLGAMLGLDETGIGEVWKDQRELKAADVSLIAALLNLSPAEIAHRAGISTPVPVEASGVERRLAAIEAKLDEILRRLG